MHPAEHWHRHAQETRELAAMASLPRDKLSLLKMAEDDHRQAKAAARCYLPRKGEGRVHGAPGDGSLNQPLAPRSAASMRAIEDDLP